jgi:predicted AAA+ superfamily ATPase
MFNYFPRIVDKELDLRLEAFGATLIVGPKWCGKTTTGEQKARSILRLQDPDKREGYLATAATKPSLLLRGENPRLIDEWQVAPVLWDAVRVTVDSRQTEGLYILTGSTSVDNSKIMHSGTGRISRLRMHPMSLFESNESSGSVSLRAMFDDPMLDVSGAVAKIDVEELVFATCRGGWPASLRRKNDDVKLMIAKDYVSNICETDISTVDGVQRNPSWARTILRSYARNISTLVKKTSIHKDVVADAVSMTLTTFESYVAALENLFVIEDIDAWCPSIRSQTSIRSGKKRGFVDPSIAAAVLGLKPDYLLSDLKTFGFLFECLCLRDLKVYSNAVGGRLSYFRDRYGLESDAVLHLEDGRYALIEIKLGNAGIEQGAQHLLRIASLISEHNANERQCPLREPDLLIVISGGEMSYRREDGVHVIPISTLRD